MSEITWAFVIRFAAAICVPPVKSRDVNRRLVRNQYLNPDAVLGAEMLPRTDESSSTVCRGPEFLGSKLRHGHMVNIRGSIPAREKRGLDAFS
jgi:hypothetical protein